MTNQVYGFFMPNINLIGFGAAEIVGEQVKMFGGKKSVYCYR